MGVRAEIEYLKARLAAVEEKLASRYETATVKPARKAAAKAEIVDES